jgi:mono/diheme cytochrome c family protein
MKALAITIALLAAAPALAAPSGSAVYSANCAFCHQARGVGVTGQFPRLETRTGVIASNPAGRDYLITLLFNGMSGHVNVDGQDILGLMPGFSMMADEDIAAVLTYISRLGKTKSTAAPFTEKEIAAMRANPILAPGEVVVRRSNLVSARVVPP